MGGEAGMAEPATTLDSRLAPVSGPDPISVLRLAAGIWLIAAGLSALSHFGSAVSHPLFGPHSSYQTIAFALSGPSVVADTGLVPLWFHASLVDRAWIAMSFVAAVGWTVSCWVLGDVRVPAGASRWRWVRVSCAAALVAGLAFHPFYTFRPSSWTIALGDWVYLLDPLLALAVAVHVHAVFASLGDRALRGLGGFVLCLTIGRMLLCGGRMAAGAALLPTFAVVEPAAAAACGVAFAAMMARLWHRTRRGLRARDEARTS
jgi:hypothetical protein